MYYKTVVLKISYTILFFIFSGILEEILDINYYWTLDAKHSFWQS